MALSKKLRFEVFKRDSFTCQYCGKSAPDVILHVDHIDPKSKGGKDSITNLITSCKDCNLGKKDIRLDDSMAVTKQKKQLDLLQERRMQLKMMMDWQDELIDLEGQQIEYLSNLWKQLIGGHYCISEFGLRDLKTHLLRFGFNYLVEAMKVASTVYIEYDQENKPTKNSVENAFTKIPGIAYNNKKNNDDPEYAYASKIASVLSRRYSWKTIPIIKHSILSAVKAGVDPDRKELLSLAHTCDGYNDWNGRFEAMKSGILNGKSAQ